MDRQLYRSRQNKVIAGVCGGIAEYFRIDPVIVRILWIALGAFGAGIFIYIIAAFLVPERPKMDFYDTNTAERDYGSNVDPQKNKLVLGGALVLIGVIFMLREVFHWFDIKLFWPLILILVGAAIVYRDRRRF